MMIPIIFCIVLCKSMFDSKLLSEKNNLLKSQLTTEEPESGETETDGKIKPDSKAKAAEDEDPNSAEKPKAEDVVDMEKPEAEEGSDKETKDKAEEASELKQSQLSDNKQKVIKQPKKKDASGLSSKSMFKVDGYNESKSKNTKLKPDRPNRGNDLIEMKKESLKAVKEVDSLNKDNLKDNKKTGTINLLDDNFMN